MSDILLHQQVIDELDFEPSVDAGSIGVSVEDRVVTLSGHVPSFAVKLAALNAARRVRNVRAVADEIDVRYPFDKQTSDDQIAKRAADILEWSDLSRPQIQITVRHGWITLAGEVDWFYQKRDAEAAVRKLTGVRGIHNNIIIRPHPQTSDVKLKIEAALKRHAEVEARNIRVTTHDGTVTLEGKVHDLTEKYAAEDAAWAAPGVRLVQDKLQVV